MRLSRIGNKAKGIVGRTLFNLAYRASQRSISSNYEDHNPRPYDQKSAAAASNGACRPTRLSSMQRTSASSRGCSRATSVRFGGSSPITIARLYRFALARMGHDTAAAEDAAQAALSRALQNLGELPRRSAALHLAVRDLPRRDRVVGTQDRSPRSPRRADGGSSRPARGRRLACYPPAKTPRPSSSASSAHATSRSRSIGCRRATATRSSGSTSKASPRKRSRPG